MIIKSIRVATGAGVRKLRDHLWRGDENDAVALLRGTEADVVDFHRDAKAHDATFAVRHWIVSPERETTREEAFQVVTLLAQEFGFDALRAVVVEHEKPRARPDAFSRHWHICVGELDPVTGRVLSSSHDRPRQEFIARRAEAVFGHPFTLGAHHKSVLARLRREGLSNVADALDAARPDQGRPRESFTHSDHQRAKREGVDLPMVRQIVRNAWSRHKDRPAIEGALAADGLSLRRGEKPGEWIVEKDAAFLGSLRRLAGVRKAEFFKRMEEQDNERHESAKRGASHSGGGPRDSGRGEDAGAAGRDRRCADRDGGVVSPDVDRLPKPHRVGNSEARGGHTGPAPRDLGAGNHVGSSSRNLGGLTADVTRAVAAARDSNTKARALSTPPAILARKNLAHAEHSANALIDAAQRAPGPDATAVVEAERELKTRRAEYAALHQQIDAVRAERRRLIIERQRPFWTRWRGREEREQCIATLESHLSNLGAEARVAEHRATKALAAHARAEQAHKEAIVEYRNAMAMEIAAARAELGNVACARRVLTFLPRLAWCGPAFVAHTGERIEKKRRELRDPWATNIWGLPIAGPGG